LNPYLNSPGTREIGSYKETREDGVEIIVRIWKHKTSGGYAVWETRQPKHNQLNLF